MTTSKWFMIGKHFRINLEKVYAYEKQDVIEGESKAYGFTFYLEGSPTMDVPCRSLDEFLKAAVELDKLFWPEQSVAKITEKSPFAGILDRNY